MKIVGIVTSAETKQGDRKDGKGKWVMYNYTIKDTDGSEDKYSTFDSSAFGVVKEGKAYIFDYEMKGEYRNLVDGGWREVDPAEYGLVMSAPNAPSGSSKQDEFRRSKVEMRWTEAYHMATRITAYILNVEPTPDTKTTIVEWAEFFYGKLADSDSYASNEPETAVEILAKKKVTRTPPTKEEPVQMSLEDELFGEDMKDPRVGDNFMLLKKLNDARSRDGKEHTTVEQMNKHAKKLYEVDTVRDLTVSQMNDLIEDIEVGKAADKRKIRSKSQV